MNNHGFREKLSTAEMYVWCLISEKLIWGNLCLAFKPIFYSWGNEDAKKTVCCRWTNPAHVHTRSTGLGHFVQTRNATVFLAKTRQTALLRVKLHTYKMSRVFTIVARHTFTDPNQILLYRAYVRLFCISNKYAIHFLR